MEYKHYKNGKIILCDNDKQIGWAYVEDKQEPAQYITGVFIKEKYRNKGYGCHLIKYITSQYKIMSLYVDCDNIYAIALYKKCGFFIAMTIGKSKQFEKCYMMVTQPPNRPRKAPTAE